MLLACITLIVVLDKNIMSGPTISYLFLFESRFIRIGPCKHINILELTWPKKGMGTNFRFIKVYVLAGTHIGIDACLRCECQWSTLPSQLLLLLPGRRASLFLINLLWKRGKSLEKRKKLGWSDLYRRSKIFHWVVHAVSTGDKTMGHWLLAVPAWWSLAENKKHSVGPLNASTHRENPRYAWLPIKLRLHVIKIWWPFVSLHAQGFPGLFEEALQLIMTAMFSKVTFCQAGSCKPGYGWECFFYFL